MTIMEFESQNGLNNFVDSMLGEVVSNFVSKCSLKRNIGEAKMSLEHKNCGIDKDFHTGCCFVGMYLTSSSFDPTFSLT